MTRNSSQGAVTVAEIDTEEGVADEADLDETFVLDYDDQDEIRIGEECINSRNHAIFTNVAVGEDGLFHCPFVEKGKCNHEPSKLLCNYW